MTHPKLLFVTSGKNSCTEYLRAQDEIEFHILDLCKDIILTADQLNEYILDFHPDLLIVYRCPHIISGNAFSTAEKGAYNIHPSLLPKYRGLNPWPEIIKSGDKQNGVTIHRITGMVDTGEILYQKTYPIAQDDTIESARNKADIVAADLLAELLADLV